MTEPAQASTAPVQDRKFRWTFGAEARDLGIHAVQMKFQHDAWME